MHVSHFLLVSVVQNIMYTNETMFLGVGPLIDVQSYKLQIRYA